MNAREQVVITAAELAGLIQAGDPVTILDVRWRLDEPDGRAAYRQGHLPGAVYVSLEDELSDHAVTGRGRHPLPSGCDDRKAREVKRTAVAAATAGIALSALIAAAPAHADPLNPTNPDYCGRSENIFACTGNSSTYPNAGESGFLDATRGRVPGTDAQHLAAGRAVCLELPTRPTGSVVTDVANHLRISAQDAGQVIGAAMANICPGVQSQG